MRSFCMKYALYKFLTYYHYCGRQEEHAILILTLLLQTHARQLYSLALVNSWVFHDECMECMECNLNRASTWDISCSCCVWCHFAASFNLKRVAISSSLTSSVEREWCGVRASPEATLQNTGPHLKKYYSNGSAVRQSRWLTSRWAVEHYKTPNKVYIFWNLSRFFNTRATEPPSHRAAEPLNSNGFFNFSLL